MDLHSFLYEFRMRRHEFQAQVPNLKVQSLLGGTLNGLSPLFSYRHCRLGTRGRFAHGPFRCPDKESEPVVPGHHIERWIEIALSMPLEQAESRQKGPEKGPKRLKMRLFHAV